MLTNHQVVWAGSVLVCLLHFVGQQSKGDVRAGRDVLTANELEKRVLAGCRDSIRSGKVELVYGSQIGPSADTKNKATIWFEGDRYRLDQTGRKDGMTTWGKSSRYILADGQFVEDLQADVLLNIYPQTTDVLDIRERRGLYDPRCLGFVPGGVSWIAKYGYSMIVGRADRSTPVIEPDAIGDLRTYKVSYTTTKGVEVTCWFACDMGYRPVQIKERFVARGHTTEYLVRSELKQFPQGGIWYPIVVDSTQHRDGKLVEHDVVTVESAEFNIPIDPAVFTVAGLNPQPGRRVVDTSSGKEEIKMWNGKTLVPVDPVTAVPVPTEPAQKVTKSRWFLIGNAAFLCVMGAFVLLRAVKR